MQLKFHKYQGNGNDFIIIDNRENLFPADDHALIRILCNRNFGIGADGLILLENRNGFDFHMRYFNSDGREGSMCGNGGRCIINYAAEEIGLISGTANFSGIDGTHEGRIDNDGTVHLKMKDVDSVERDGMAYLIDTGSPHLIIFADRLDDIDVVKEAREIRYGKSYKEKGINVNYVRADKNCIYIRSYERGVENETLACGTGSVAAAIATAIEQENFNRRKIIVNTRGGALEVSFRRVTKFTFTDIWLTGPARQVFTGHIETDSVDCR